MDHNLKHTLIWIGIACIAIAYWISLYGCAESHVSMCRQRSVECALVYGEIYHPDEVGIASGAVNHNPKDWHSQAYVDRPEGRKWLKHYGHTCVVGAQEPFTPSRFESVGEYLNTNFGQFGHFTGPRVP